ncbi:hypothetical protein C8R47DRAFT_1153471 [Mycena vitilis]|nr:hypothetical protein C8R47DRAFT_1153471 [Mycena vitilis]
MYTVAQIRPPITTPPRNIRLHRARAPRCRVLRRHRDGGPPFAPSLLRTSTDPTRQRARVSRDLSTDGAPRTRHAAYNALRARLEKRGVWSTRCPRAQLSAGSLQPCPQSPRPSGVAVTRITPRACAPPSRERSSSVALVVRPRPVRARASRHRLVATVHSAVRARPRTNQDGARRNGRAGAAAPFLSPGATQSWAPALAGGARGREEERGKWKDMETHLCPLQRP